MFNAIVYLKCYVCFHNFEYSCVSESFEFVRIFCAIDEIVFWFTVYAVVVVVWYIFGGGYSSDTYCECECLWLTLRGWGFYHNIHNIHVIRYEWLCFVIKCERSNGGQTQNFHCGNR